MSALEALLNSGATSFALGGAVLTWFWKAEDALSQAFKESLSRALRGVDVGRQPARMWPSVFAQTFDRFFGADPLRPRFILGSLLTTVFAIAIFLGTYLISNPDFTRSIINDDYQRQQVLSQVLSFAFMVNAAVDFICLAYFRNIIDDIIDSRYVIRIYMLLLKDLLMKILLFIVGMIVVYIMFTTFRGSFGSEISAAAMVIPGTLWGAIHFENLTAVYLYSSLISSIWLWLYLLSWLAFRAAASLPLLLRWLRWALPLERHPVRSIGLVAAAIAIVVHWLYILLLAS